MKTMALFLKNRHPRSTNFAESGNFDIIFRVESPLITVGWHYRFDSGFLKEFY